MTPMPTRDAAAPCSPTRLLLLALVAVATACGGEDRRAAPKPAPSPAVPATSASPAAGSPATPVEAATAAGRDGAALAARLCEVLHDLPARRKAECCGTAGTSFAAVCTQELSASVARGAVALDAAAVEACATELARQLEGCRWASPLEPAMPPICTGLIAGKLEAGARCGSALECPDGLVCRGVSPGVEGACAAPPPLDAPCANPADSLAAITRSAGDPRHPVCEGRCVQGRCLPFAKLGESCKGAECVAGLNCVGGTCQDAGLPGAGQPCTTTDCGPGTFCREGLCAPLGEEGEPCKLPFECRGLNCAKEPGSETGKCGPPCGSSAPGPAAAAAP